MSKNVDIPYAELCVASNFSFLRGASHPDELVTQAAVFGYGAVAITDRNSVAGIVRGHVAAKEAGIRYIVGVRLVLTCGFEVLTFPKDRAAYGRLTKLLTKGNRRAEKGTCILNFDDLRDLDQGHIFIAVPEYKLTDELEAGLLRLSGLFGEHVYLGLTRLYQGNDDRRMLRLKAIAKVYQTPLVAIGDILYHQPNRRPLQDILTCIREHVTIMDAGMRLQASAERHMKTTADVRHIFKGYEDAVHRTSEIMHALTFSLDELRYEYPNEPAGESATPQEELERLTWLGAKRRYPDGISDKVKATLEHELSLIKELNYASYFLTVDDIVRYARDKGILCQGRGSAANSAVCFCLGITSVDPTKIDLLFERFISADRNEPPDIDVDFEHERREEVIQYIYEKYGRHRAGIAATVVTYRTRSAVREVGTAMGLSLDTVSALSANGSHWSKGGLTPERVTELGLDLNDPTLNQTLILVKQIAGFPRHLSQHVGGFVITNGPLDEVIPIANAAMADRTYVEWDKDDLDALGILKIDILALGMLSAIRKAFKLIEDHYERPLELATVPAEDQGTYEMICRADTVGVFQIESRAQMSMLPRLRPREFYDLVIEIAIVRPGPIQGDMVHPYLKRRQKKEKVEYPSRELEEVLSKTLGVPLFQEQAMKIAIVGAGFTPSEADRLRKAMATFKRSGSIDAFKEKFIKGMIANKYTSIFAEQCFKQIEGFSDYGFPESHSASFALLAYVSSWLKCYYPDVFTCALLNSLPMGFYSSASLVRDLQEHGGTVLPPDINKSLWDHTLEPIESPKAQTPEGGNAHALRLGLRQIKGIGQDDAEQLVRVREQGFDSVRDLYFRTGFSVKTIERLARADAFRSIGLDRRTALWAAQGLGASIGKRSAVEDLPLFNRAMNDNNQNMQHEAEMALPSMPLGEHVIEDYTTIKLSLKGHPLAFLRPSLSERYFITAEELKAHPDKHLVSLAGLVLVRQRPGTASGVIFATLEDETGVMNIIIWPKLFEAERRTVIGAKVLGVVGQVQKEDGVIHVVARQLFDLNNELVQITGCDEMFEPHSDVDEFKYGGSDARDRRDKTKGNKINRVKAILPKGRNFH
ncbi:error-prone DNA polymerase [Kordiimonas sp. SCSIO 12610]|uniref:error-prone DNA polymerase n=1 Tax=Kordiimonas sp. SCSIO 12610 TaxID=2829597 RepID=UPI00210EE876|nr:error-prone DNA polymerase [Kordiimonas sp. SCSIO 12610]UTW54815.1 error-prone DNA polymerase [Kordiimonas sp. SCSIO 12610]